MNAASLEPLMKLPVFLMLSKSKCLLCNLRLTNVLQFQILVKMSWFLFVLFPCLS